MTDERQRPTHFDLFSGIGGFSLAFEAEGFHTIGFSEIDPYASAVLKKHWPGVRNYGDVRTIPAIKCDVVTGGFPCQPFSTAGEQRGASDDRFLWPAMLNVIDKSGAAWVLGENVPGITDMELDRVLADLEYIGYEGQPFTIPACAVTARHLRNRIWVIAHNTGKSSKESALEITPWEIHQSRKPADRLSEHLWKPNRQTYLFEMAGEFHGISEPMGGFKCLGNSIVPAIAQIFAKAIYQQIMTEPKL